MDSYRYHTSPYFCPYELFTQQSTSVYFRQFFYRLGRLIKLLLFHLSASGMIGFIKCHRRNRRQEGSAVFSGYNHVALVFAYPLKRQKLCTTPVITIFLLQPKNTGLRTTEKPCLLPLNFLLVQGAIVARNPHFLKNNQQNDWIHKIPQVKPTIGGFGGIFWIQSCSTRTRLYFEKIGVIYHSSNHNFSYSSLKTQAYAQRKSRAYFR